MERCRLFLATLIGPVRVEEGVSQYASGAIVVSGFFAEKAKLDDFSPELAGQYLVDGTLA